jgi:uncharacterized membrane protein YoaK (UPF0700 family)
MPLSPSSSFDAKANLRRIRHLLPGAMALAGTAGYVNSVVLGFFRTPVSHMTGAVSHLGIDLSEHRTADAGVSLSIILGFITGAVLAGILIGAWKLIPGRRYGVALMAQGTLLAVATWLIHRNDRQGLFVVAMSCGLQNAMTSSYCGLLIRTTHMTGMVTDIGLMIGHWIRHRQVEGWKLRFLVLVFLAFGAGGWIGAMLDLRYGPDCLVLAAGGCVVSGGLFWFLTHHGLVDFMQDAAPHPPRIGTFTNLPPSN